MKSTSLLVLCLICLQAFGQYDPEARGVLDAMSAKYKKIQVFSTSFEQNLKNDAAGLDEAIAGEIMVNGDKYKLIIAGQEIYNDGTDIYTFNEEINEVTVTTYEPEEDEISLSNIYDLYKEGFKYGIQETQSDGTKLVDLEPEDRDKSYFKIRMEIAADYSLNSFSVFEPSGNVYVYSIKNFKERSDLSDADFTFNVAAHEGVEVVDFR